jgi:hypothetical protein
MEYDEGWIWSKTPGAFSTPFFLFFPVAIELERRF